MKDGDKTSILLNDTVAWVEAKVSKMLEGHIEAGRFEVGDVVEIVTSLGAPQDLHIVSQFFKNFSCLLFTSEMLFFLIMSYCNIAILKYLMFRRR